MPPKWWTTTSCLLQNLITSLINLPVMFQALINKIKFFKFILDHPLNKINKFAAIKRFFFWQFGSRLVTGSVLVPFVDNTVLRVSPGMTGATGNIYCGLHEFEDMSFLLHMLRPEDLFVDIGANIGSYTILAGGAVGARCISVEPICSTFRVLNENIIINRMVERTHALNIGISVDRGVLKFTDSLDTVNHVLPDSERDLAAVDVPVISLNELLENQSPVAIKIDVEGFENNVVEGGWRVLSKPTLLALIMELNGSGKRYGFDDATLHEKILSFGFKPYVYFPFDRKLVSLHGRSNSGNTLYVRDFDEVQKRLREAKKFLINNVGNRI